MYSSRCFYEELPALSSFKELANFQTYPDAPNDWYLVITDVVSSTKAIEQGKYKDINLTAALSLVSVINLNPDLNCPFIFGGDGVTFLISEDMLGDTLSVLTDNRRLVKETFDLSLRVGYVAVKEIYQSGYQLKIGKYQVSATYAQLLIFGNGIDYAESLIKNPPQEAETAIDAAQAWMRNDDMNNYPEQLRTQVQIHQELQKLLPGHDPFWPRWIVTVEKRNSGLLEVWSIC